MREVFGPLAVAAASYEFSNTCTKKVELVMELPRSEDEMTVEKGVTEIN